MKQHQKKTDFPILAFEKRSKQDPKREGKRDLTCFGVFHNLYPSDILG